MVSVFSVIARNSPPRRMLIKGLFCIFSEFKINDLVAFKFSDRLEERIATKLYPRSVDTAVDETMTIIDNNVHRHIPRPGK